jgi:hypothetical protein
MAFAPCVEADTRLRTGVRIGPLTPAGWSAVPRPQLELAFERADAA